MNWSDFRPYALADAITNDSYIIMYRFRQFLMAHPVHLTSTTNLHHNTCLTLFNQSLQPVAIVDLVCVLVTLLTMSNVALGLSLESGHLASLARLPGITYLRTCNTALTQMYSRKGSRHFCSKVHSLQILILFWFYVF